MERKVASVLFADLVGSTELGEQDPERTRILLERFYDAIADEVELAGGTLEKFAGDAVMAAFGGPIALEDHAERALHAALAMQRRVAGEFDGLELRIGVNTGEVVAGRPREGSSFVTGDPVNVCARLEQAAAPGEILAGERTVAGARAAFEFGPPQTIEAKGKREPVPCRRVERALSLLRPRSGARGPPCRVRRSRRRARRPAGGVRPHGRAARAAPRHDPRRARRRQDAARPRAVGVARCAVASARAAYRALPVVRACHDVPPDRRGRQGASRPHRERGARARARPAGQARDPRARARARCRRPPAPVGGAGAPAGRMARARPRAARRTARRAAPRGSPLGRRGPARPARRTLDRAEGQLLLVCTARGELLEARPGWGGARRPAATLELEPLSASDAERLLTGLLEEEPPTGLLDVLVARAAGNPFFLEELLATVIDRGVVARADGVWRVSEGMDELRLPDSVRGVVAARIDLLPEAGKVALQAASVIGRAFWTAPVHELLPDASPDVGVLVERDFVRRRAGSTLAGDAEYVFKHQLTREVAYESLPKSKRGRLHAAFAAWLERLGSGRDEYASMLAHHYAEAVRPEVADLAWGDDSQELERLQGQAIVWLRRAGVLATRRFEVVRRSRCWSRRSRWSRRRGAGSRSCTSSRRLTFSATTWSDCAPASRRH